LQKIQYSLLPDVNLGIKAADEEFKKNVSLAADGQFGKAGLEWRTGQDEGSDFYIDFGLDSLQSFFVSKSLESVSPTELIKNFTILDKEKNKKTPLGQVFNALLKMGEVALDTMSLQYLRDDLYDFFDLSEDTREMIDLGIDLASTGYGIAKAGLKHGKDILKYADELFEYIFKEGGKGLLDQVIRTEQATGLQVIAYGPDLKGSVFKSLQNSGKKVFKDYSELIKYLKSIKK